MGSAGHAAVLGATCALIATTMACSTKPSSPNTTVGQCVLQDHVWYCGGAYGNYPACQGNESCDNDASLCFSCDLGGVAGDGCSCVRQADGGRAWECIPSGTGCQCPAWQANPGCN